MAVVPMQKVAILAHHVLREELIQRLHEAGVLQVNLLEGSAGIDHTEVNFRIAELHFAIQTLAAFASKEIVAAAQKAPSPDEIVLAAQRTDVRGIVDTLHAWEKEDTDTECVLQEKRALEQTLRPWVKLPLPLDEPMESRRTIRLFGMLPAMNTTSLGEILSERLPRTWIDVIGEQDDAAYCTATIWKEDVRLFEEFATAQGWTAMQLPVVAGTARAAYEEIQGTIRELEQGLEKRRKERARLAVELPNLVKTAKYMDWLTDKQAVRESLAATKNTIALMGWVPKAELNALEADLHRLSPAIALLKIKPDEGEEPPVQLKHPKIITPFVSVTTLYGLPLPTDLDPTAALSPFFILFFALCLTDGGYGLVLALIFGIVLLKKRPKAVDAPLIWLLFFSGIVSILVGIPFGGWFGLTPDQVPGFLTKATPDGDLLFKGQIWNLSTQEGVNFLQNLALGLGLTHLMFGMFLSGYHKWVHGNKAAAIWQDFTSHLLIGAAIFAIAAPLFPATRGLEQVAMYIVYASVALAVWGKGYGHPWYLRPLFGLLGLMNLAIGMLSNGLSYLRILALGLVTGAMALAVNQVAVEMGKLFPIWIAVPVIIIIFLGGHLVSIALNTLGSFIHSGRLQFIEFFSQFFEGGGRPFTPFRRS